MSSVRRLSKRSKICPHLAWQRANWQIEIQKGTDQLVVAADKAHKILTKDLTKMFEGNPKFAYHFIREAMTGETKFGGNDGTCTHFLTCDFNGENVHYIPVTDEAYVRKIANQSKGICTHEDN